MFPLLPRDGNFYRVTKGDSRGREWHRVPKVCRMLCGLTCCVSPLCAFAHMVKEGGVCAVEMKKRMEEERKRWYAMKVYFNRVFAVEECLKEREVETYYPTEEREVTVCGKRCHKVRPVIPSLIFVHTTEHEVLLSAAELAGKVSLYKKLSEQNCRPVAIPDHEMNMFMLVASSGERGVEFLSEERLRTLKPGNRVRVTDGPFKGSEGNICRIRGARRMIVQIEGVCAVVTTYIPNAFLQIIDE